MLGPKASVESFLAALELRFENVHEEYLKFIGGAYWGGRMKLSIE